MGFRLCLGASVALGFAFTHHAGIGFALVVFGKECGLSHEATSAGIVVVFIGW